VGLVEADRGRAVTAFELLDVEAEIGDAGLGEEGEDPAGAGRLKPSGADQPMRTPGGRVLPQPSPPMRLIAPRSTRWSA
jgi:hypothetical protein